MAEIKRISMECPHCGATMRLSEDKKSFICDFCGHKELIQEEDYKKKAYEEELGKARAREAVASQTIEYKANAAGAVFKIIGMCAIASLVLMFIVGFLVENFTPKIKANPYEWAQITVSGFNEDGYISIKNTNTEELAEVTFEASKKTNLANGDKIIITANKSSKYDHYTWEPETMEYTVEGLPMYLSSISELSDEQKDVLKSRSLELLNENWEYNKKRIKEPITWEIKPKERILFGKGRYKCLLYDCYETHVYNETVGDLTIYQAVRYAEPLINPAKPAEILYTDRRLDNLEARDFWFGVTNMWVKEYGWTSSSEYEDYWISLQNIPLPLLDRQKSD